MGSQSTDRGASARAAGGVIDGRSKRGAPTRCVWCGRRLPDPSGVGRRRKYCGQSCRQRAYEDRSQLLRRSLPLDAVVLTGPERDDLADRLYQMCCAAEDVSTALGEGADRTELADLVDRLLAAARAAERIR